MSKERTTLPEKCKGCQFHKIVHGVRDYNFCSKIGKSFCGAEPKEFFNCEQ